MEALFGVRDPMGVRPLCIGRLEDAWIITSESVALDILGARFVRDVEPGEIVGRQRHGQSLRASTVIGSGVSAAITGSSSCQPLASVTLPPHSAGFSISTIGSSRSFLALVNSGRA